MVTAWEFTIHGGQFFYEHGKEHTINYVDLAIRRPNLAIQSLWVGYLAITMLYLAVITFYLAIIYLDLAIRRFDFAISKHYCIRPCNHHISRHRKKGLPLEGPFSSFII